MLQDLPTILNWYFVIFLVGIIFLPLTKKIFSHFFDGGYAFSKILGILLTSYTVWLLSSIKIVAFSQLTIFAVLVVWLVTNLLIFKSQILSTKLQISSNCQKSNFKQNSLGLKFRILSLFGISNLEFRIFLFEELLFLLALLFWSWVRGHEPSIHGLEKFMDFGFINSILNSQFFPPQDMWLAQASDPRYTQGFFINYYYFGHYVTAFLTKLTGILPEITYNLMLSTVFGLCFSASFSIGANLIANIKPACPTGRYQRSKIKSSSKLKNQNSLSENWNLKIENYKIILGGLLTAALVTLAGNLHTIYLLTSGYPNENPVPFWQIFKLGLNLTYWYPNATRFIPNTIHEFPSYSWIVADLHGHVLDIPFVLLIIGVLLALITKSQVLNSKSQIISKPDVLGLKFKIRSLFGAWNLKFGTLVLLGLCTAVLYMTNAWDGVIYLGLAGIIILASYFISGKHIVPAGEIDNEKLIMKNYKAKVHKEKNSSLLSVLVQCALLIVSFLIFSLPFNLNFQPFVHGIGVVGGWEMTNFFGLIKPVTNALPGVELALGNLPKAFTIGPFLLEQGNNLRSPLWMLGILWGFFYFNVTIFLLSLWKNSKSKYKNKKPALPAGRQTQNHSDQNPKRFENVNFKNWGLFRLSNFVLRILNPVEIFLSLLILLSTALLIFPEFFYMKDIYPAHYRANTMFKLGYQAFIMLSIVSGYVITQFKFQIENLKRTIQNIRIFQFLFLFLLFDILFLILVLIYPYFGIQAYYGVFGNNRAYEGQNGMLWLKTSHPGDYDAILWLRKNVVPKENYEQPITVLEAVGDSYTDYSRISANTGLATILGWPVHEWLWRGSYDEPGKRVEEAREIYEQNDPFLASSLLEKYNVKYVVVGNLEREKYKNLKENLFAEKGEVVFNSFGTKIYKLLQ